MIEDKQETENTAESAPLPVKNEQESSEKSEVREIFSQWAEALDLISHKDMIIASFLNNSTAYTDGGTLLIKGANPIIESFLTKPEHYKTVENAIYELTGNHYKIITGNKPAPAREEIKSQESINPLEALLQKAKQLNIDISDKQGE